MRSTVVEVSKNVYVLQQGWNVGDAKQMWKLFYKMKVPLVAAMVNVFWFGYQCTNITRT
jgi:hypothetical protein